jgi:hypothetical protein
MSVRIVSSGGSRQTSEPPLREPTFGVTPVRRRQLAPIKLFLIFGLCGIAAAACGYAVHALGALQQKFEMLERDVKGSVNRVATLTGNIEQILESQRLTAAAITRLEAARVVNTQLEPRPDLPEADLELLRIFFKLTRTVGVSPKFKLGDQVSSSELKVMPEFVAAKISPELRGTRFLFDRNGSLIITAGPNNEVIVIVPA